MAQPDLLRPRVNDIAVSGLHLAESLARRVQDRGQFPYRPRVLVTTYIDYWWKALGLDWGAIQRSRIYPALCTQGYLISLADQKEDGDSHFAGEITEDYLRSVRRRLEGFIDDLPVSPEYTQFIKDSRLTFVRKQYQNIAHARQFIGKTVGFDTSVELREMFNHTSAGMFAIIAHEALGLTPQQRELSFDFLQDSADVVQAIDDLIDFQEDVRKGQPNLLRGAITEFPSERRTLSDWEGPSRSYSIQGLRRVFPQSFALVTDYIESKVVAIPSESALCSAIRIALHAPFTNGMFRRVMR